MLARRLLRAVCLPVPPHRPNCLRKTTSLVFYALDRQYEPAGWDDSDSAIPYLRRRPALCLSRVPASFCFLTQKPRSLAPITRLEFVCLSTGRIKCPVQAIPPYQQNFLVRAGRLELPMVFPPQGPKPCALPFCYARVWCGRRDLNPHGFPAAFRAAASATSATPANIKNPRLVGRGLRPDEFAFAQAQPPS